MRKSLLTLAALTCTCSAWAQSSVTLYGVVDTGLSYYQATDAFKPDPAYTATYGAASQAANTNQSLPRRWVVSNSGNVTSQLGFRGKEDLGGGYNAGFWLEMGITPTTGALSDSTTFMSRASTVYVGGPFGKLEIGRQYTPQFWNDYWADPFRSVGTGPTLLFKTQAAASYFGTSYTKSYVRHDNAFTYFLPDNLGGLYGEVQGALDQNPNVTTGIKNGKEVGARLGWRGAGADVAGSYAETFTLDDNGTTAGQRGKVTTMSVFGSYDMNVAKIMGQVNNQKYSSNDALAHNFHSTGYVLGLIVPVGQGSFLASYSHVTFNGIFANAAIKPKADQLSLGYVYNLSKRTVIYTTGAYVWDRNGALSTAATSAGYSNGGLPTGTVKDANGLAMGSYSMDHSYGFDIGIRHSF